MRVLCLTPQNVTPSFDTLLGNLEKTLTVTSIKLTDIEMDDLSGITGKLPINTYDRSLVLLKFRRIRNQAKALQRLPGLVIWETDALQDRMRESAWYGEFSKFYSTLPEFRLICTGYSLTQHFRSQGIDAHFLGRGADTSVLYDTKNVRDIELGFLGRLSGPVYEARKRMVQFLQTAGLQVFKAQEISEYRNTLNRIRIFISPDMQFGEHLYKNFEAMACGCLLIAYRNGNGEEEAIGMIDGENVLLYRDQEEVLAKILWARNHPEDVERIRLGGNRLVHNRWGFAHLGKKIAELIEPPILKNTGYKRPWWSKFG